MLRNLKVDFFLDGFKLSLGINWGIFDGRVTHENFADALSLATETEFSAASVRAVFPDAYPDGFKGWSYKARGTYSKPLEVAVADGIQNEINCYLLANLDQVTEELHAEEGNRNLKLPIRSLLAVKFLSQGRKADAEALLEDVEDTQARLGLSLVMLNFHAVQGDVDSFNSVLETFPAKAKATQSMEDLRWLLCAAVTRAKGFDVGKLEYERQGFSGIQPTHYALRDLLEVVPAVAYSELVQKELSDFPNIAFEHLLASARKEHEAGESIDALLTDCERLTNEVPPSWPSGTPWTERSICVWQLGSFLTTIERLDDATRIAKSLSSGSKTRKQLLELISDAQLALDNPTDDIEQLKRERHLKELEQILRDARSPTTSKSRLNEAFRYQSARRAETVEERNQIIEVPLAAASNPAASEALIGRALNSENQNIRLRAASNLSASQAQLESAFSIPFLRPAAAGNPSLKESLIGEALEDSYVEVQAAAAGNPSATEAHIGSALGDNREVDVRKAAAGNPSANSDQINRALNDRFAEVRSEAASNPAATSAHLEVAFADSELNVRKAAAGNSSASVDQLEGLLKDPSRLIRSAAARNPSMNDAQIQQALNDPELMVRADAAGNLSATEAQIAAALTSNELVVRLNAAKNPSISDVLLAKALDDDDSAVRKAAAEANESH